MHPITPAASCKHVLQQAIKGKTLSVVILHHLNQPCWPACCGGTFTAGGVVLNMCKNVWVPLPRMPVPAATPLCTSCLEASSRDGLVHVRHALPPLCVPKVQAYMVASFGAFPTCHRVNNSLAPQEQKEKRPSLCETNVYIFAMCSSFLRVHCMVSHVCCHRQSTEACRCCRLQAVRSISLSCQAKHCSCNRHRCCM